MPSRITYTSVIPQPTYQEGRRHQHCYLAGKYLGLEYGLEQQTLSTVYLDLANLDATGRLRLGRQLYLTYGNPDGYYLHPRYHCLNYYANGYTLSYRRGPGNITGLFGELSNSLRPYDLDLARDITGLEIKYRLLLDYFVLPHLVELIVGYCWGLQSRDLF